MPAQDIRHWIASVVHAIKSRANRICSGSCDGQILRMHYRWTFFIFLATFFAVWYQWYYREVITCVSHFNAETPVRLDYANICLSYPYVDREQDQEKSVDDDDYYEKEYGGNDKDRRYLLFYRWISWSFLFLTGIYYIPRKISKHLDNSKCRQLLEDIASNASRYDQTEGQLVDKAATYMIFNLRTHDGLYWKYVFVNILALIVDIFTLNFLDFVLQGRFLSYGIKSYPFIRDPRAFSDHMSQTFPPFASCEISTENQLVNKRNEKFGCHLTIMELYEKVFLVIWFWLILLTTMTCCYIVFLGLLWIPWVRIFMLRSSKPNHGCDRVVVLIKHVLTNCSIGDIYMLYRLRQHLSHARFYELMSRLSAPTLNKKALPPQQPPQPPHSAVHKPFPQSQIDAPMTRKPDVSLSPQYLQQLMMNQQQGPPHVGFRNSSILVD